MKYCITYDKNFRHLQEVNEIILPYHGERSRLPLIDMVKDAPAEQRFILSFEGIVNVIEEIEYVRAAMEVHDQICIRMEPDYILPEATAALQENEIPFFVNKLVNSVDEFVYYLSLGVSDIYIVEELGFNLRNLKTISEGVQIRCFANVAQSVVAGEKGITSFFIRPEDVTHYEGFVDVIEFFGPIDRQSVLYEIYNSEEWNGKISDLIIGLNVNISNMLINNFGHFRVGCNKKCNFGKCNLCKTRVELAELLQRKVDELNDSRVDEETDNS